MHGAILKIVKMCFGEFVSIIRDETLCSIFT